MADWFTSDSTGKDWLDQEASKLCRALQEEIQENPFLDAVPGAKRRFIRMLEKCAEKAKSSDDRRGAFNQGLKELNRQYTQATGTSLSRSRLA